MHSLENNARVYATRLKANIRVPVWVLESIAAQFLVTSVVLEILGTSAPYCTACSLQLAGGNRPTLIRWSVGSWPTVMSCKLHVVQYLE